LTSGEKKRLLRAEVKERLSAFTDSQRADASSAIAAALKSLGVFKAAESVFIYNSFGQEPYTHGIIKDLLKQDKKVFLPIIKPDGKMVAVRINAATVFQKNVYGIEEPLFGKNTEEADKSQIDLAVIPLLAFDAALNRLGRGKGYYDRYLNETNAVKIALAFSVQEIPSVPTDANDIGLDAVITEKEIFFGSQKR
jgi:5-formyltetrahydrofolate cyclo-ligase